MTQSKKDKKNVHIKFNIKQHGQILNGKVKIIFIYKKQSAWNLPTEYGLTY